MRRAFYYISVCLFCVIILVPVIIAQFRGHDGIGIFSSAIYVLPLVLLLLASHKKSIGITLMTLPLLATIAEMSTFLICGQFLNSGLMNAILTTTQAEAANVANSNWIVALYLVLLLIVYVLSCVLYKFSTLPAPKIRYGTLIAVLLCSIAYYSVKTFKRDTSTMYWYEDTVLSRPPYNFYCSLYQGCKSIIKQKQIINASTKLRDFHYDATRQSDVRGRETYVFCIGESMRYKNLSLCGYERCTTPNLSKEQNLLYYTNYYTTGCLTMFALPLLITPATPEHFEYSYTKCSVLTPFKEVGFKTFVLVTKGQFLTQPKNEYLRVNADSLIIMDNDSDMIHCVQTLSKEYPKTFFLSELWGSHHPYYNYPPVFDVYVPNHNTDVLSYTDEVHFMNAYDNTILYTDYLLSRVMQVLSSAKGCSACLYVSDHGEAISNERYGHGFDKRYNLKDKDTYKDEYHVPLLLFYTDQYAEIFPHKVSNFAKHKDSAVNADYIFGSVLDMADIKINDTEIIAGKDLFLDSISIEKRTILLTDGECIYDVD